MGMHLTCIVPGLCYYLMGSFDSLGFHCSMLLLLVYLRECFLQSSPSSCCLMQVCIFLVEVYEALKRQLAMVLLVEQMKCVLSFCLVLELLPCTWGVVFGCALDGGLPTLVAAPCVIVW